MTTPAEQTPRRSFARGRHAAPSVTADRATLVAFSVATFALAVPVGMVERVLRCSTPFIPLDDASGVEGVVHHRGRDVPVVDLRWRLLCPITPVDANSRIIVCNVQQRWVGALVDAVSDVLVVEASSIVAPPEFVQGFSASHLLGMLSHHDATVLVVDIARLLSTGDELALQHTQQPVVK
jgi:purine-binding chemotaxis protein CheW